MVCSDGELKSMRIALGFSAADVARLLDTPLRTYQGWEAGEVKVPGVALVAMRLLQERDRWVMGTVMANITARVERDFPHGIVSEPFVVDGG